MRADGMGEGRIEGWIEAESRMIGITVSAAQTTEGGSADDPASPGRGLQVRNFLREMKQSVSALRGLWSKHMKVAYLRRSWTGGIHRLG